MQDIDGNTVKVGDTIKVLEVYEPALEGLSNKDKQRHRDMLGKDYVIDDVYEDERKVSITITWGSKNRVAYGGLKLLDYEFRLVQDASKQGLTT